MSELYGFCTVEQRDVPIVARSCPKHAGVVLPPSWGRHTDRWVGSGWQPARPRPAGWAPAPVLPLQPRGFKKAAVAVQTPRPPAGCPGCGRKTPVNARGASRMWCSRACELRTARARAAEERCRAFVPYPCEVCARPITQPPLTGGRRQRFCQKSCKQEWWKQQRRRERAAP